MGTASTAGEPGISSGAAVDPTGPIRFIVIGAPLAGQGISPGGLDFARIDKTAVNNRLSMPKSAFILGKVYVIPNPAIGVKYTVFHIEVGVAERIEIKIYAPNGDLMKETTITDPPKIVNGVYTYEYKFFFDNISHGTCKYIVKAYKEKFPPIEASGQIFFININYPVR